MKDTNLNRLEARIWVSYFQDGIWDVFIGILMLTAAVRTFVDHWVVTITGFMLCMSVLLLKRFVTVRRIGFAKFSRKRRRRRIVMFSIILAANIVTLLLFKLVLFGVDLSVIVRVVVFGCLFFITFSIVAYFLDFWRFFLWGILFTIDVIITEAIGNEVGSYFFLGTGLLALIVGIVYFIRFLGNYPADKGV